MILYNYYDILIYTILYLFFYNISLVLLFIFIWTSSFFYIKTLNNLKEFNNNSYKKYSLLILFLSIAGIPPFVGFFFKLNLISLIGNSSFLLLFLLFFFLFAVLFFYLQNVKYLLIPINFEYYIYSINDLKTSLTYIYLVSFILFFITFGLLFLDDFYVFIYWLLV